MKTAKIVRVEKMEDLFRKHNPNMPFFGKHGRGGTVEWRVTYKIKGNKHHFKDLMALDALDAYKKGFDHAENQRKAEIRADLDAWDEIRKYMPNAELPEKEIKRKRKEI